MKVKIKELIALQKAFQKIASSTTLNPKSIYGAANAIRQIKRKIEDYKDLRKEWFFKLGEVAQIKDPKNPDQMIDNPRGDRKIKKENEEQFRKLNEAFEDDEIDLYNFKLYLSDLTKSKNENEKFSIDEISDLLPWIVNDLQEREEKEEEEEIVEELEVAPQC